MSTDRINEIISELFEVSEQESEKSTTMIISRIGEGWQYKLYFSDEELHFVHNLTVELNHLMKFQLFVRLFEYKVD